ncbi:uncharacterized protein LY89DRAFT_735552 [Mollisia scopiformis]|uniref:Uncharacterized protein n=1 Tax=Mollisia scopiformis TaxID=149040 RepID=A0A194X5H9_MOLSC|nr:uncharacterized protein LY89DRAFT_735552 [Mollisia scopiformis]KUJ15438.1 hypothetical protein LY89DRAFT_735552 [Mollisia scopiformis]
MDIPDPVHGPQPTIKEEPRHPDIKPDKTKASNAGHISQPIAQEDFELGRLNPESYSLDHISKALVANIERVTTVHERCYSARQKRALQQFRSHGTWNIAEAHNIEDITRWFAIFNDAFFGGLLTGDANAYCSMTRSGSRRDPRYPISKPYCTLTFRRTRHYVDDNYAAIKSYQECLLHEMSHAIFDIYECGCTKCYACIGNEAAFGHGAYWQAVAQALEEACRHRYWEVFGLCLTLNRSMCLVDDVQSGCPLPNDIVLRSVGLDIVHLLENIKCLRGNAHSAFLARHRKKKRIPSKSSVCLLPNWTVDSWERNFSYNPGRWDSTCHSDDQAVLDEYAFDSWMRINSRPAHKKLLSER